VSKTTLQPHHVYRLVYKLQSGNGSWYKYEATMTYLGALKFPQAMGVAGLGAPSGIHIDKIELPPPPEGGVPDARYQAVQLARELSRRGGR